MKDTIYQNYNPARSATLPFEFNEEVVQVFDDMINRSVPGYRASIELAMVLAAELCEDNDHIYDLGCSLGATTFALIHQKAMPKLNITAVDLSKPMMNNLYKSLVSKGYKPDNTGLPCQFVNMNQQGHKLNLLEEDILTLELRHNRITILNYVLQFIKLEKRTDFLKRIFSALKPGGVLLLSEKIVNADQEQHELLDKLHLRFKRLQGYSDLEIAAKRSAIENVLIPETFETHQKRLLEAGFKRVTPALCHFNFMTLIAEK